MSDMQGRVCIVTGATSGIGEATALALARLGGTVVVIGRNEEKAKATIQKIKSSVTNADVSYLLADLSLMRDVKRVADEFRAKFDRLDVLVNNAGVIYEERKVTAEGLEMTFALNHMSYFYLTNLLIDMLKASGKPAKKSRVVSVSSGAHQIGKLDFSDLQSQTKYRALRAYGQSKMMNIIFTWELAQRFTSENANVTATVLHPGGVRTGFAMNNKGIIKWSMSWMGSFLLSPEQGAQTSIYLASSPDAEGVTGKYFTKSKPKQAHKNAYIESDKAQLWSYSEDILKQLGLSL